MGRDNEHKIYKGKWACFECRKCFKQRNGLEIRPDRRSTLGGVRLVLCPQCRRQMTNMGWDFKVPRYAAVQQWKKVELLAQNGFLFDSFCCGESHKGPGPRPARLKDVSPFLEEQKSGTIERRRKQRIQDRAAQLKKERQKKRRDLVKS